MSEREFDTPQAAEAAFYQAFSSIDLDLMASIWIDGDRAACIHPGSGLLQGKQAVMQSWMEIFSGSEPPLVEYRFIDGFESKNMVVRLVEERIRPRDEPASAANRLLATNVYLREGKFWRLAEHHASLPLVDRRSANGNERKLH
jgi:hypothetical protein